MKIQKLAPNTPIFKNQKELLKWIKKRQKGKGSFVHMNYDCGDTEYNNQFFNSNMGNNNDSNNIDNGTTIDSVSTGMSESLNTINHKISPKIRVFIQEEKDLIQNSQWEELLDKLSTYQFLNNDVVEFYYILKDAGVIISDEIKEISFINRLNKSIAKLKGNPDRYKTFLKMISQDGIYYVIDLMFNHTYGFDEEEIKNILFEHKDKLAIPIEELKF